MRRRADLFDTTAAAGAAGSSTRERSAVIFDNMVIVRILEGKSYAAGEVGHVSLEIPRFDMYVSMWPSRTTTLSITPEIVPEKWCSRFDDPAYTKPDLKFFLFSLDTEAMFRFYETRKTSVLGWMLQGTSSSVRTDTDNCTSIVYRILMAGGADKLAAFVRTRDYASASPASANWVPNQLAKYLPLLVKAEQSTYPESMGLCERAERVGPLGIIVSSSFSLTATSAAGGAEARLEMAAGAGARTGDAIEADATDRLAVAQAATASAEAETTPGAAAMPTLPNTGVSPRYSQLRTRHVEPAAKARLSISEQMLTSSQNSHRTLSNTRFNYSLVAVAVLVTASLPILAYFLVLYLKNIKTAEQSMSFNSKP